MIGTAPLWGTHIYYVNIKLMKHFSVRFEAQLMRGLFFISSRTWEFWGEYDIPKIDKERKQPPRIPQPIPWVPRGRHPNHPSPSPFFRGLRVPGDAFQISTIEAHDAMVKFGSMPQCLEATLGDGWALGRWDRFDATAPRSWGFWCGSATWSSSAFWPSSTCRRARLCLGFIGQNLVFKLNAWMLNGNVF